MQQNPSISASMGKKNERGSLIDGPFESDRCGVRSSGGAYDGSIPLLAVGIPGVLVRSGGGMRCES